MASGNPREPLRGVTEIAIASPEDASRRLRILDDQIVRIFLVPLERRLGPVDPDAQAIFLSNGNLRGIENAFCSSFEADQHIRIIFQQPTFDERREIGTYLVDLQASDITGQIFGVRSDVSNAT